MAFSFVYDRNFRMLLKLIVMVEGMELLQEVVGSTARIGAG